MTGSRGSRHRCGVRWHGPTRWATTRLRCWDYIDAAMFVCGHELIRSRDDAGSLHYSVGRIIM